MAHTSNPKTIVIGGGLIGSAAAWQLSNRGEELLLIEQQAQQYEFGSSFGDARIARSLGPQGDIWSFLHDRALVETKHLIEFLNTTQGELHQMTDIYTTAPVSYVFYKNKAKIGGFDTVLNYRNDYCQYAFSDAECQALFGMKMPEMATAFVREYKEHSGTMNPKELLRKLHLGIQGKKNNVLYHTKVDALIQKDKGYQITCIHNETGAQQVYTCQNLVVAGGCYTGNLLSAITPKFQAKIQPKRVFLAFFKPNKKAFLALSPQQKQQFMEAYPAIYFTEELSFAMIESIDTDGIPIIKIGGHFCRSKIKDYDQVWKLPLEAEEIDWGKQRTLEHLQDANLPFDAQSLDFHHGYSCVYSLTASEVPLVTNLLHDHQKPTPNMVVMAGMSGVGGKGAMTYGLIAANLLLQHKEKESELYNNTAQALYR